MSLVAFVIYEGRKWTLAVGGSSVAFGDAEEAVEEARARLQSEGGGTIYLSRGPGVEAGSIPVEAEASPSPLPVAAPTSSPAPSVSEEPSGFERGVLGLCASYEEAEEGIKAFDDPIERDAGLGTLRLEARNVLERLRGSRPAPVEEELRLLSDLVQSLSGGKASETMVKGLDAAGRKVLRDVGSSLVGLKLTGALAFIVGVLIAYSDYSVELGAGVATAALAGGSVVIVLGKVLTQGAPVAEQAFLGTTRWAEQLGAATEATMARPRQIEQALLAAFSTTPPRDYKPLASRARLRAELIVIGFWIMVAVGAAGFLVGVWSVLSEIG